MFRVSGTGSAWEPWSEYAPDAGIPGSGLLSVQESEPVGREVEGSVPDRDVQRPEQYESDGAIADRFRRHRQIAFICGDAKCSDCQHITSDPNRTAAFVLSVVTAQTWVPSISAWK